MDDEVSPAPDCRQAGPTTHPEMVERRGDGKREVGSVGRRDATGSDGVASAGQHLPALCPRPVAPTMEEEARQGRRRRHPVCGRLRGGLPAPSRRRAIPTGTSGKTPEILVGAAPRGDAPHRIWEARGGETQGARTWETGNFQLPRLHARVQQGKEWTVSGESADDGEADAGEAEGSQSRASATPAPPAP